MEPFTLEKPDLHSVDLAKLMELYSAKGTLYKESVYAACEPEYYYWDKVKYKTPPEGLNSLQYWSLIKHIRKIASRQTVIKAETGERFTWLRLLSTDEQLHGIDMTLGGEIFTQYSHVITSYGKRRLLTKSIIEEAIASSQLEGAATTTPIAKRMLLENRPPMDRSERMIVNNYRTMQALNERFKQQKLSHAMMYELHELITKDTLDKGKQGRYRKDSHDITVNDGIQYIYHTPPQESFFRHEMERLIAFANDEHDGGFMHPVIKAIFLHFWIGYLHPFYDGNGRIARTLFYWYLLRKGYWAIQYLPISLAFKRAYIQYGMAYVYAEQDDFDVTYFYDFHMKKLLLAIHNFSEYIQRKVDENMALKDSIGIFENLNDRQQELIRYLLMKGKEQYVTPSSYIELYKISRMTARNDIRALERLHFLYKKRVGTYIRYYTTDYLREQSERKSGSSA